MNLHLKTELWLFRKKKTKKKPKLYLFRCEMRLCCETQWGATSKLCTTSFGGVSKLILPTQNQNLGPFILKIREQFVVNVCVVCFFFFFNLKYLQFLHFHAEQFPTVFCVDVLVPVLETKQTLFCLLHFFEKVSLVCGNKCLFLLL